MTSDIKQVKKEKSPAKKQEVPVQNVEVVEQPKVEPVKQKKDAEIKQEIEVISDETPKKPDSSSSSHI